MFNKHVLFYRFFIQKTVTSQLQSIVRASLKFIKKYQMHDNIFA